VPDHRRAEGKIYQLAHVLLFSILGTIGNSVFGTVRCC
jgi:hypothetical protein